MTKWPVRFFKVMIALLLFLFFGLSCDSSGWVNVVLNHHLGDLLYIVSTSGVEDVVEHLGIGDNFGAGRRAADQLRRMYQWWKDEQRKSHVEVEAAPV